MDPGHLSACAVRSVTYTADRQLREIEPAPEQTGSYKNASANGLLRSFAFRRSVCVSPYCGAAFWPRRFVGGCKTPNSILNGWPPSLSGSHRTDPPQLFGNWHLHPISGPVCDRLNGHRQQGVMPIWLQGRGIEPALYGLWGRVRLQPPPCLIVQFPE